MGAVEKYRANSDRLAQWIEGFVACWVLLVRQLSPVRSRDGEQRCTEAVSAPINLTSPEEYEDGIGDRKRYGRGGSDFMGDGVR